MSRGFIQTNERGHEIDWDGVAERGLPDLDHTMTFADFDGGFQGERWWRDGMELLGSVRNGFTYPLGDDGDCRVVKLRFRCDPFDMLEVADDSAEDTKNLRRCQYELRKDINAAHLELSLCVSIAERLKDSSRYVSNRGN